jgi:general stress protein 26
MAEQTQTEKLTDLVKDFPIAMVATRDNDGQLKSQPLAMQQQHHPFDGQLWFLIAADSSTATRLDASPAVNVVLSSNSSWVSISGDGQLTADRDTIASMWDASVEAWFPDGQDDPNLRALIVHAESAEYWDTPGGKVATALSFVKSKVSGQPIDIDNEKVDL